MHATTLGPSRAQHLTVAASLGLLLSSCAGPPAEAPYVKLIATPARGVAGETVVLQWATRGARTCVASGAMTGPRPTEGTEELKLATGNTKLMMTCEGPGGTTKAPLSVLAADTGSDLFPVRPDSTFRELVDRNDVPFLIKGDAAWSIIAQLRDEEIDDYLEKRRSQGFNALLVNLLEHKFADHAPNDAYNTPPFLEPGDFRTPNPAYFNRAVHVVERAERKGFLVLLAPAYLGFEGGSEGWYAEMERNGPDALREFGRYVGRVFAGRKNILWVHGGDFNPPNRDLVRAIGQGVQETSPPRPTTAHAAPETAALEYWRNEPWLTVNSAYSYRDVQRAARDQYRNGRLPMFVIESHYEHTPGVTADQIRAQGYEALLSGARGYVYGNHPIWHFGGPGYYPVTAKWQAELTSTGASDIAHLWRLMDSLPWWRLSPDDIGRVLKSRLPPWGSPPIVAVTDDGALAIVYTRKASSVTIDLSALDQPAVSATWFDPTDGGYQAASLAPLPAQGTHTFRSPGLNRAGAEDWVLILRAGDGKRSAATRDATGTGNG